VDLRRRHLGAMLGLASRVSLTEEAGSDEPRNGQPDD
jgi:hypothetical protein